MGFFDRLKDKQEARGSMPSEGASPDPQTTALPRLAAAREKLEGKDLPGAMAIYEEVLQTSGDRADVLVTISGDLGATGNIPQIIELVAPRYDALRHGPATGINLVQAYLAVRDPEAAQHVLDILFSLNRPELENRLHGFSNAIADLMTHGESALLPPEAVMPGGAPSGGAQVTKVALISISKPIWAYGLETLFPEILPPKTNARKIAFVQLALPGAYPDYEAAMKAPSDELQRLSKAIPFWLAEVFSFTPSYSPIAAIANVDLPDGSKHPMIFPQDWTAENLRQLNETSNDGLDYAFTGSLTLKDGTYTLTLRLWEVKKYKDRKQFAAKWTAATAEVELAKVAEFIRGFMEWKAAPAGTGITYSAPRVPTSWLKSLAVSGELFLAEKGLMAPDLLPKMAPIFDELADHACDSAAESLSWLTLIHRSKALGIAPNLADIQLSMNPVVAKAKQALG
jgi:hypothetical protein